ncbi:MAG: hypothetical protein IJC80_06820 [Clostridia bacterium]|nr:hypothetical protein [Clostridia bacterium]
MKIPNPFIPLRVETNELSHTISIVGRSYTFGADGMISSVISEGEELLAAPMRLVLVEDGECAQFQDDYLTNESESFIQSRSDEKAVICGCLQSERFIVDFCTTVSYDGVCDIDLKLMPRGLTVAQALGVEGFEPLNFKLDKLWLEIPLKRELCSLFHMHPGGEKHLYDGSVIPSSSTSGSGKIPKDGFHIPFKPILWLGNEKLGLGWFCENDRNWQYESNNKAIEIIYTETEAVLRIRLLDGHPKAWTSEYTKGFSHYAPIDFHFGFQATPVKPFPKNPYIHNALHLDCGIKVKGNYKDFLGAEGRFDRLKEKGVTTLILHEKWNKSQNWFEISEYTEAQLKYIVDECHKRGIKVYTYFGYEISTMSPMWSRLSSKVVNKSRDGKFGGGWWRVPFQRALSVCYNSEYADYFACGIAKLMDMCNIDGIYLDSTANPRHCYNTEHGCGWYDMDGNPHGSYPLGAIRKLFMKLHEAVHSRGGHINVHFYGVVNFTVLPYIDQVWCGETLQSELMQGKTECLDLDFFRTEYIGRNMGVPTEFLAYERRPLWKFEDALSCAILHGILPRPNDIEYPLELMSGVWKIFDGFPITNSMWMPYWENKVNSSDSRVKVSYYKYEALTGEIQLLAFAVNTSHENIDSVTIKFEENCSTATDLMEKVNCGFSFSLPPFGHRILFVK